MPRTTNEDLTQAFYLLCDQWVKGENLYVKTGQAFDVNTTDFTFRFVPDDESAEISSVKLKIYQEEGSSDFFIPVPTEGSPVIVAYEEPTKAFCIQVKSCATLYLNASQIVANSSNISVDSNQTTFNGGSNGGLININDLTTKINQLIVSFNEFVVKYNAHTHNNSVGPPVLNLASTAIPFVAAEYEDTKITH